MFKLYNNVRVLDASRILVGPYATMMLGDLGAQVIKIESHEGDETRHWGPPFVKNTNCSTYFLSVNRNKKSLCLNLKDQRGQRIFQELAAKSDVIVENFNLGVTERLGIDYSTIRRINPSIIYASINGFGSSGPLSQRSGFDFIVQAASGLMSITGEPDGAPTKAQVGIALTDILTALQACNGIQAALYRKALTGEGCHLQTSLFESAMASLMNVSSNFLNGNMETTRIGNMHPSIVPYGVYRVKDQHMMLAAATNTQFQALCTFLGRKDLFESPLYNINASRVANRDSLTKQLEKEFLKWDADELCAALNLAKIPASRIQTVGEGLNSSQAEALSLIQGARSALYGDVKLVRSPLTFDGQHQTEYDAPPLLNEHRDKIMSEVLEYSPDQCQQLIEAGVLKA